ncbi:MAG: SAM-dependent chlorinase/fluorinase, partial [Acidobacteriota bacterium]
DAPQFVTLYTDFGWRDPWVGSMKCVLWSIDPALKIVDVTHDIPSHDIFAAAFALFRSYRDYPPRTVHVCVVDPGVGSKRRPILVAGEDHYFVGPDNGVFSFIYAHERVQKVVDISAEHYFRRPVSQTFHGRDIFAPVAGWLAKGIDSSKFGEVIDDYVRIPVPEDRVVGESLVKGEICEVDRFGNLITNIRKTTLDRFAAEAGKKKFKVLLAGQELPLVTGGYAQQEPLFALINSSGLLEIASSSKPASKALGIQGRGKEVGVMGE